MRMELIKVDNYIVRGYRPRGGVHCNDTRRLEFAQRIFKEKPADKEYIIKLTVEFLNAYFVRYNINYSEYLKENKIETLVMIESEKQEIFLQNYNTTIKERYSVKNNEDIVWMKFTESGHLGVVAVSNDVNFDIPETKDQYDEMEKGHWKYTTSGIIVHSLEQRWDNTFFLVFPLPFLKERLLTLDKKERHCIETGIGNYLLEKGIPILDYYSHRY